MEKTILKVEGMSCDHCIKTITGAVGTLPGVAGVAVDLAAGTVTVDHDPGQTDIRKIKMQIEEQGYDVVA